METTLTATSRQQVKALLRANPRMKVTDIADQLGISRARVYAILKKEGLEREWVPGKAKTR